MKHFVDQLIDIPQDECWIIVQQETIYHEGDERSRTNPGHGYPAHNERLVKVHQVFDNQQAFVEAVGWYVRNGDTGSIRGFKVQPYKIKATMNYSVAENMEKSREKP